MTETVQRLTKNDPRFTYGAFAALAGLALTAASVVPLDPPDVIPCGFLIVTGYPCPFCGSTRAFAAMGHGLPGLALAGSPLAAAAYVATAALFLFGIGGLVLPARMEPLRRIGADLVRRRWFWITIAVLLAANWVYRLAAGMK